MGLINREPEITFTQRRPDTSSYSHRLLHLYSCASALTSPCISQKEFCLWDWWIYGHRHPLLTADLSISVPEKLISSTIKQNNNCQCLIRWLQFLLITKIFSAQTRGAHGARGYSTIITWREIYAFKIWLWQTIVREINQLENKFHKPLALGQYTFRVNWDVHVSIWIVRYEDLGLCGPVLNKYRTINPQWNMSLVGDWTFWTVI